MSLPVEPCLIPVVGMGPANPFHTVPPLFSGYEHGVSMMSIDCPNECLGFMFTA